jgi:hypothetical protein
VGVTAPSLGARIRATTASARVVGTLLGQDAVMLRIEREPGNQVMVPVREITNLEQGRRRSRGRGALIGLAVGAVGGAIYLIADNGASGSACPPESFICFDEPFFSDRAAAAIGAVFFGGVGALVGALIPPGEKWEPVSFRGASVSVTPARGRGAALNVSLSF